MSQESGYRTSVNNGDDPLDRNQAARLRKQVEAAEAVATEQARLAELQALKARIPVTDLFERWATAVTDALLARGVTRMAKMIFSLIDAREWFIPADNSKNGRPHTIHLSDFALRHFAALQAINGTSQWCFPNRDDSAHVCVKTVTKQRGDATPMSRRSPYPNALTLPGGKWTPHDLHRTAATLMTALGVLPEVAEKCLNHTEESRVKRTYQWHSYDAEKREAWRLLGERLELLTRGDNNVVTLKRRNKSAEPLTA